MLKTINTKETTTVNISITDVEPTKKGKSATYYFKYTEVEWKDMPKVTTEHVAYASNSFSGGMSPWGVYYEGYRRGESLIEYGNVILYDFDEGIDLDDALDILKGTDLSWHIVTSSSHQMEKKKVAADGTITIEEPRDKFRLIIRGQYRDMQHKYPSNYDKGIWKAAMWLILGDIAPELKATVDSNAVEAARQFKCNTTGNQIEYSQVGTQDIDMGRYLDDATELKRENLRTGSIDSSLIPSDVNKVDQALNSKEIYFKDLNKTIKFSDAVESLSKFGENLNVYSVECPFDVHTNSTSPAVFYTNGSTAGVTCRACNCNVKAFKENDYSITPTYTNLDEYDTPIDLESLIGRVQSKFDSYGSEYNSNHIVSWKNIGAACNKVIQDNTGKGRDGLHTQYLNSLGTGGGKSTLMTSVAEEIAGRYGILIIATKITAIDEVMVELEKYQEGYALSMHSQMAMQDGEDSDYYNPEAYEVHKRLREYEEEEQEKANEDKLYEAENRWDVLANTPVCLITQASFKLNQDESREELMDRFMDYNGGRRALVIVDEAISYNEDIKVVKDEVQLIVEALDLIETEGWIEESLMPFDLLNINKSKLLLKNILQLANDAKSYNYSTGNISNGTYYPVFDDYGIPVAIGVNQDLLDAINEEYEDVKMHLKKISGYITLARDHRRLNKSRRFPTAEEKKPWFVSEDIEALFPRGHREEKKYQASLLTTIRGALRSIEDILDTETFYFQDFGKISICSAVRVAPKDMSIAYLDGTCDVDLSGVLMQQYKSISALNEETVYVDMPKEVRNYQHANIHFAEVNTGRSSIYKTKTGIDKDGNAKLIDSGSRMQLAGAALLRSLPKFSKSDKVLFIGYKDMKHYFLGENGETILGLPYAYDYTYWAGFYGENRWSTYNKIVMFGSPEVPLNNYYNNHMLMTGYQHAIVEASENDTEFKTFKSSIKASQVIQGINRSATRVATDKEGNHIPVDIYITVGSSEVAYKKYLEKTLKEQMPNIKMKDDWDFTSWNNNLVNPGDDDYKIVVHGRPVKRNIMSGVLGFLPAELSQAGFKMEVRKVAEAVGAITGNGVPTGTWKRAAEEVKEKLLEKYSIGYFTISGKPSYFQKLNKRMLSKYLSEMGTT